MRSNTSFNARIRVWDPFVRLFHWSLVLLVLFAALSGFVLGATWFDFHIWTGTMAAGLIFARIVWGFLGTDYARFHGFVTSPAVFFRHISQMRRGAAARHLGHNPAGGWMILALIALIALLALTGTILLGGVHKSGPLGFAIDYQAAWVLGGGHLWLANILLFLITLHVAGALFESWRTRENLPRAMIDGMKERRAGDHAPDPVAARPLLAGTSIAAGLAIASLAGAAFAPRPAIGVPSGVLDPVYADECAACHVAFHPSLLSRSDWSALMETLEDHYGEDASLDTETSAAIKAWLVANASETADTRAAHVFRRTDPAHPFTITKTPFWVQRHAALDPALFTAKPVYSRANCPACHTDAAQGLFHPASISLPKESKK